MEALKTVSQRGVQNLQEAVVAVRLLRQERIQIDRRVIVMKIFAVVKEVVDFIISVPQERLSGRERGRGVVDSSCGRHRRLLKVRGEVVSLVLHH